VVHNVLRGRTMADRKLARIGILKIGDTLVPAIAFEASQIMPSGEWRTALNFQLRLERVSLIPDVIRCWCALVDEEYRNRASPRGKRFSGFVTWTGRTEIERLRPSLPAIFLSIGWLVSSGSSTVSCSSR